jgi:hypothetical protein
VSDELEIARGKEIQVVVVEPDRVALRRFAMPPPSPELRKSAALPLIVVLVTIRVAPSWLKMPPPTPPEFPLMVLLTTVAMPMLKRPPPAIARRVAGDRAAGDTQRVKSTVWKCWAGSDLAESKQQGRSRTSVEFVSVLLGTLPWLYHLRHAIPGSLPGYFCIRGLRFPWRAAFFF